MQPMKARIDIICLMFQGDKGDKGERGYTTTLKGDQFPTGIIEGPPGPPGPPGNNTFCSLVYSGVLYCYSIRARFVVILYSKGIVR